MIFSTYPLRGALLPALRKGYLMTKKRFSKGVLEGCLIKWLGPKRCVFIFGRDSSRQKNIEMSFVDQQLTFGPSFFSFARNSLNCHLAKYIMKCLFVLWIFKVDIFRQTLPVCYLLSFLPSFLSESGGFLISYHIHNPLQPKIWRFWSPRSLLVNSLFF